MKGSNLKYKQDGRTRSLKRVIKGKSSLRVFPTKKKKTNILTGAQQEELVLTHRIKARKLARSILRKWHSRLELQEVDSIVDLSLCEAVRRYNPAYGASFITFLYYHMRGNLIRAVTEAANQNMVPVTDAELEITLNAESSVERRLGVNASEVAHALSSEDSPLPDEHLFRKEVYSLSNEACLRLDPLEREVINRIYLQEQQLIDVAAQLGYSRCHISRVKRKALEVLYGDLADSLEMDKNKRPENFDDLDETTTARRTIHRRRPRSAKVSKSEELERLAA